MEKYLRTPFDFLEIDRVESKQRPIKQHILDFDEFLGVLDIKELTRQSARCMDCGIPFCHAGIVLEGTSIGCPLGNVIPEINDLVYRQNYPEAYKRLKLTNPFPEFTSRVCPSLCEGSCTLGEHEPPVTIKEIERYLDLYAETDSSMETSVNISTTFRKVAVIGSGPAGLAAADVLSKLGEQVTVFERADRAGGLLMYGIPQMKLEKDVVGRCVQRLEEQGVEFKLKSEVGKSIDALELIEEFDALIVCSGSPVPRMPEIRGKQFKGYYPAMSYLTYTTKRLLDSNMSKVETLEAKDKDVIIVGNGDTATDCVATAVRQNARSITQLYYRAEPAQQRISTNPWPLYPKVRKTDYGQLEAAAIYGKDPREYLKDITEIIGDKDGFVKAVKVSDIKWVKRQGKTVMQTVKASTVERPAQLVLIATGFRGPDQHLLKVLGLETNNHGRIATKPDSYATNKKAVFVAGDVYRGSSLVVWAIKDGRDAAKECHEYLNNRFE